MRRSRQDVEVGQEGREIPARVSVMSVMMRGTAQDAPRQNAQVQKPW